jgi:glycine betaine/proline transport system ATP-binding protein
VEPGATDVIRAEEITKLFGRDPDAALPLVEAGKGKQAIQAETRQILGVNRVSFDLRPGEIFVIMGLSGSGKSTLIRCINRLIEPTAGRLFFVDPSQGEVEITGLSPDRLRMLRKHHMSMVFQHFALFPHLSVLANATYGLEVQGIARDERQRRGQEVLELVGLGDWASASPAELSGGMQQRVGLARALATEAEVLLMDEPFSALDPLIKVNMQQELMGIQARLSRTILFITHDLDEAMRIGDRIAIMEDGAFVQVGTPEEILVNPRTEYVARFVEHADPTGVITAGTIARPLAGRHRAGGYPGLELELDEQGRLRGARHEGCKLRAGDLDTLVDEPPPATRHTDLLLQCGTHTSLRRVLRGRLHSALPVLVLDDSGRVGGLIDEPALIAAILDKRGPEAAAPASREVTHE